MHLHQAFAVAFIILISSADVDFSHAKIFHLAWERSTDSRVVGYRLHCSAHQSPQYVHDLGDVDSIAVVYNDTSNTLTCSITGYDAFHEDSDATNSVALLAPSGSLPTPRQDGNNSTVFIEYEKALHSQESVSINPDAMDFDGDGYIDGIDLAVFMEAYNNELSDADLNFNGIIDTGDIEIMSQHFGKTIQ